MLYYSLITLLPLLLAIGLRFKLQYPFKKALIATSFLSLLIIVSFNLWALYVIIFKLNHETEQIPSLITGFIKTDFIFLGLSVLYNALVIWVIQKIKPYPVIEDAAEANIPWMYRHPMRGGFLWAAITVFLFTSLPPLMPPIFFLIERIKHGNDAGSAALLLLVKFLFFLVILLPTIATQHYYSSGREAASYSSVFKRGFAVSFVTSCILFYLYIFHMWNGPRRYDDDAGMDWLLEMAAIAFASAVIALIINILLAFIFRKKLSMYI